MVFTVIHEDYPVGGSDFSLNFLRKTWTTEVVHLAVVYTQKDRNLHFCRWCDISRELIYNYPYIAHDYDTIYFCCNKISTK